MLSGASQKAIESVTKRVRGSQRNINLVTSGDLSTSWGVPSSSSEIGKKLFQDVKSSKGSGDIQRTSLTLMGGVLMVSMLFDRFFNMEEIDKVLVDDFVDETLRSNRKVTMSSEEEDVVKMCKTFPTRNNEHWKRAPKKLHDVVSRFR